MGRRPGRRTPRAAAEMLQRQGEETRGKGRRRTTTKPIPESERQHIEEEYTTPTDSISEESSSDKSRSNKGSDSLSRLRRGSAQTDKSLRSSPQNIRDERPPKGVLPGEGESFIDADPEVEEETSDILPLPENTDSGKETDPYKKIQQALDVEQQRREDRIRAGELNGQPKQTKLEMLMEHSPEDYITIIKYIGLGAFPYIAAETMGVAKSTFDKWMKRGRKQVEKGIKGVFALFWSDIMQATARARLVCELQVRKEDPKYWLRYAAKTKGGRDGWTDQVGVTHTVEGGEKPIEVEHKGGFEMPTTHELGATLKALVDIGYVQLTPFAQNLIERMDADKNTHELPSSKEILEGEVVKKERKPEVLLTENPTEGEELDYDD